MFWFRRPMNYLAGLSAGRLVLWFYLIWYLVVLVRYFDPSPSLWLTSLGLSVIIGTALRINARTSGGRIEPWTTFRFYLTPLCVSSFSALVKGRGFFLVLSPRIGELFFAMALCGLLWLAAELARRFRPLRSPAPDAI